jgi:chromosome segregation ATPase
MATSEEVQAVRKDIQDFKLEVIEFMKKATEYQEGAENDREVAANIRSNLATAVTEMKTQLVEVIDKTEIMDASLATNSGTTAELIDNYKTMENKLNIVEENLGNNANKVIVMDKDIAKVEKDIKLMSDKMDTAIMGRVNNRIEELQEAIDNIKEKLEKVAQGAHATGQPPGSVGSGAGEPQSEHYGQEGTEKVQQELLEVIRTDIEEMRIKHGDLILELQNHIKEKD